MDFQEAMIIKSVQYIHLHTPKHLHGVVWMYLTNIYIASCKSKIYIYDNNISVNVKGSYV
jgi:hypothetical protein